MNDSNAKLEALRNIVPRKAGGKFAPGNKHATGRRTMRRARTEVFRSIVAATPAEQFKEIWARVLTDAKDGDYTAIKIVIENVVGSRLVVEQSEEIEELRLVVEQWVDDQHKSNGKAHGQAGTLGARAPGALEIVDAGNVASQSGQTNTSANDVDRPGAGD